jgi:hypothetical protein
MKCQDCESYFHKRPEFLVNGEYKYCEDCLKRLNVCGLCGEFYVMPPNRSYFYFGCKDVPVCHSCSNLMYGHHSEMTPFLISKHLSKIVETFDNRGAYIADGLPYLKYSRVKKIALPMELVVMYKEIVNKKLGNPGIFRCSCCNYPAFTIDLNNKTKITEDIGVFRAHKHQIIDGGGVCAICLQNNYAECMVCHKMFKKTTLNRIQDQSTRHCDDCFKPLLANAARCYAINGSDYRTFKADNAMKPLNCNGCGYMRVAGRIFREHFGGYAVKEDHDKNFYVHGGIHHCKAFLAYAIIERHILDNVNDPTIAKYVAGGSLVDLSKAIRNADKFTKELFEDNNMPTFREVYNVLLQYNNEDVEKKPSTKPVKHTKEDAACAIKERII